MVSLLKERPHQLDTGGSQRRVEGDRLVPHEHRSAPHRLRHSQIDIRTDAPLLAVDQTEVVVGSGVTWTVGKGRAEVVLHLVEVLQYAFLLKALIAVQSVHQPLEAVDVGT